MFTVFFSKLHFFFIKINHSYRRHSNKKVTPRDRHHTNIATYRLNCPSGQFSENRIMFQKCSLLVSFDQQWPNNCGFTSDLVVFQLCVSKVMNLPGTMGNPSSATHYSLSLFSLRLADMAQCGLTCFCFSAQMSQTNQKHLQLRKCYALCSEMKDGSK